jgi:hypothetical protein
LCPPPVLLAFSYEIPNEDVHLIERASHYCHPIGDDRFKQQIAQRYGIKLGQAARGRRVAESAALLVDEVLTEQPVRK